MRSENILTADILDLIFENRNKTYGAYVLRKHYNSRVIKALLAVFLAAAGMLLLTMLSGEKKSIKPFIEDVRTVQLPNVTVDPPRAPKPAPAPRPPAKRVATEQFVSDLVITDTEPSKLSKNLDSAVIGSISQAGPGTGNLTGKEPGPAETGGGEISEPEKATDRETPRLTADVMPVYPGGMEALRKFLQKNLRNPEDLDEGEVISVKIRFVVGYDGRLKAFQTIEDGGATFNNEVLRVLKKMPEWTPGKSNGEKVSVYYTIPVKFTAAE